MTATRRMLPRLLLIAGWLGLVVAGFVVWELYDTTAGPVGDSPALSVAAGTRPEWELVFFAHSRCPCTRVGLGELAEMAPELRPGVVVRVVFVLPEGVATGWERGESWDAAIAIPGARVKLAPGGVEARRAGASTSGHLVVYDGNGHPVFRGGITRARSREGDSVGRRAVLAILAGQRPETRETPTFGCLLYEPGRCELREGENAACNP